MGNMKKGSLLGIAVGLVLAFCMCGSAGAYTIETYTINYSNEFGGPYNYGTVVVEGFGDKLKITATADETYFPSTDNDSLSWDKFFFNSNLDLKDENITVLTSEGTWNFITEPNASSSEFGKFGFQEKGTQISGPNSTNPFIFEINWTAGIETSNIEFLSSEGYLFAGHLRNFDSMTRDDNSTFDSIQLAVKPTSEIPEPATMLLFGTGLAGLAGISRRKKK